MIGNDCRLVCNVSVGAEVTIGDHTLLHAGVRIGDRCEIGSRVIIQPNVTIGGDGFAFVTPEPGSVESVRKTGEVRSFNNEIIRINSLGNVVIEDDVEIGAGTCIDRGTLGETRIGRGTKLDNLIQVGHNATIGSNCLIVSQVGLGGSSKVGNRVVIGGQSGLPDHVTVGDDAVVHARSGITGHVPGAGCDDGHSRSTATRIHGKRGENAATPESYQGFETANGVDHGETKLSSAAKINVSCSFVALIPFQS